MENFSANFLGGRNKLKRNVMPHCWGPYKHHPCVSPWNDGTGHSSSDKLSADGWIPHCTHYPPTSIPSRNSNQCSRQQMGNEEVCLLWSQGGKQKAKFLKSIRFSLKQIHHTATGTHPCVFKQVAKGVTKSSGLFECGHSTLLTRREEVRKSVHQK